MILVYRYRVKSLNGLLNKQARAVSFVWNYCNDRQKDAIKWGRLWPSAFELVKLTAGASQELGISSNTINEICKTYAKSRDQKRRPYLRYRGKRSLGWVPLRGKDIRELSDGFHVHGRSFRVFKSRSLPPGAIIKDNSSFTRDARGNWFLNVCIEAEETSPVLPESGVGIDLGLKDLAALSTGEKISNPRHLLQLADALARAQRGRKRRQAMRIHARIANARRDHLHKASLSIVRRFDYIAVGNVNAAKLAKTSMAKSVLDAGWTTFRDMLRYKAIARGAWYEEVDEAFSSQVCSSCGALPPERPRGIADLGIRQWVCSHCGASHDRDVNAALNLLARSGYRAPVEGAAV